MTRTVVPSLSRSQRGWGRRTLPLCRLEDYLLPDPSVDTGYWEGGGEKGARRRRRGGDRGKEKEIV